MDRTMFYSKSSLVEPKKDKKLPAQIKTKSLSQKVLSLPETELTLNTDKHANYKLILDTNSYTFYAVDLGNGQILSVNGLPVPSREVTALAIKEAIGNHYYLRRQGSTIHVIGRLRGGGICGSKKISAETEAETTSNSNGEGFTTDKKIHPATEKKASKNNVQDQYNVEKFRDTPTSEMNKELQKNSNELKNKLESDEELYTVVMQSVKFYKEKELLLSTHASDLEPKRLHDSFDAFLDGLDILAEGDPIDDPIGDPNETSIDDPIALAIHHLSEILHHHMYLIMCQQANLTQDSHSMPLKERKIQRWIKKINGLQIKLKQKKQIPVTTMFFELSAVSIGLSCCNTNSKEGKKVLAKLLLGSVNFAVKSDPKPLLQAISQGINFGAKEYHKKQANILFKPLYHIDHFRTWTLLTLNDKASPDDILKVKKMLIDFQGNITKTQYWEIVYAWIKCLSDVMTHAKDFPELQNFIYFGDGKFFGLSEYADFGSTNHNGVIGMIKSAAAMGGMSLSESIDQLDPFAQLSRYAELGLSSTVENVAYCTYEQFYAVGKVKSQNFLSSALTDFHGDLIRLDVESSDLTNEIVSAFDLAKQKANKGFEKIEKGALLGLKYKEALDTAYKKQQEYINILVKKLKDVSKVFALITDIKDLLDKVCCELEKFQTESAEKKKLVDGAVHRARVSQLSQNIQSDMANVYKSIQERLDSFPTQSTELKDHLSTFSITEMLNGSDILIDDIETAETLSPVIGGLVELEDTISNFKRSIFSALNNLVDCARNSSLSENLMTTFKDLLQSEKKEFIQNALDIKREVKTSFLALDNDVESAAQAFLNPLFEAMESGISFFPQGARDVFFSTLGRRLRDDSWRTRERVLLTLFQIQSSEGYEKRIQDAVGQTLLHRKVQESHQQVIKLMNHSSYSNDLEEVLKRNWPSRKDIVKEQINEKLDKINELQNQMQEPNIPYEKRQLMKCVCQDVQDKLDHQIQNLTNMQEQMGIAIDFLSAIKKQLNEMKQLLHDIKNDVKDIKTDVTDMKTDVTDMKTDVTDMKDDVKDMKATLEGSPPEKLLQLIKFDLLSDNDLEKELSTFVPINTAYDPLDPVGSDFEKELSGFLKSKTKTVLLLLGGAGSGKSTVLKKTHRGLWDIFEDKEDKAPIPIYIKLNATEDPFHHVIENYLKLKGFNERQINTMRSKRNFIFFLDGYDELKVYKNVVDQNRLQDWNCKIVVSCRDEYVKQKDDKELLRMFSFRKSGQENFDSDSFMKLHVLPFSGDKIDDYLKQYVDLSPAECEWDWAVYKMHFHAIPGLRKMIESPFLLKITCDVLPGIISENKSKEKDNELIITREKLYDKFIIQWIDRELDKLQCAKRKTLVNSLSKVTLDDVKNYCKKLAKYMYKTNCVALKYVEKDDDDDDDAGAHEKYKVLDKFFDFSKKPREIKFLASPTAITEKSKKESTFSFIHKSIMEYFLSLDCFEKTMESYCDHETSADNDILNSRLLLSEPSVIAFLADKVSHNPSFKESLFHVIERSKQDKSTESKTGAANAITILNKARTPFVNRDFREIQISGANLNEGVFVNVNFEGADLSRVNFTNAFLDRVDFKNCNCCEIEFSQLPGFAGKSTCRAYRISVSKDGVLLAVTYWYGGGTFVWNTQTHEKILFIDDDGIFDTQLVFSDDNKYFIAAGFWVEGQTLLTALRENMNIVGSKVFISDSSKCYADDVIIRCEQNKDTIEIALRDNTLITVQMTGEEATYLYIKGNKIDQEMDISSLDKHFFLGSVLNEKTACGVWSLETKKKVADLRKGRYMVAFAEDGEHVIVGNGNRSVEEGISGVLKISSNTFSKWETLSPELKESFVFDKTKFSLEKRKRIESSDKAFTITEYGNVCSNKSNDVLFQLSGRSPEFLPKSSLVMTKEGGNALIWDINLKRKVLTVTLSGWFAIAVDPHSPIVYVGAQNGVQVYDIEKSILQNKELSPYFTNVWDMSLIDNGVLVSDVNNEVILFDQKTGNMTKKLAGHGHDSSGDICCIFYAIISPNKQWLVTGSTRQGKASDNIVCIWEKDSFNLKHQFSLEDSCNLYFSPDSCFLIVTNRDGVAKLWDITSGKHVHTLKGRASGYDHDPNVGGVTMSFDDRFVTNEISTSEAVNILNTTDGSIQTLHLHGEQVHFVRFSKNSHYMVAKDVTGNMVVWNTVSWTPVYKRSDKNISSIMFSFDGQHILYISDDNKLHRVLLNDNSEGASVDKTEKPEDLYESDIPILHAVCISSDIYLVVISENKGLLWNPNANVIQNELSLPNILTDPRSIDVSPDGRWLAYRTKKANLALINNNTGARSMILSAIVENITKFSFSENSQRLFLCGYGVTCFSLEQEEPILQWSTRYALYVNELKFEEAKNLSEANRSLLTQRGE